MKRFLLSLSFLCAFIPSSLSKQDNPLNTHPMNSTEMSKLFQQPPAVFSSGPLWVWNDRMTREQIIHDLDELADKHVMQVFIHPRPGLMTPYLSDEWFDLWEFAFNEAKARGMLVWIYDENSYPSGFAGGHVPEEMPESIGLGLTLKRVDSIDPAALPESLVAIYDLGQIKTGTQTSQEASLITKTVRERDSVIKGDFAIVTQTYAGKGAWFGNRNYVDLLKRGVTKKFLELTLDPYKKRLGDEFGQTLLGSFTDEPHLTPAGGIHWSDDFLVRFEKRYAYPLLDKLPSLFLEVGDWKKIRFDYRQLLMEDFSTYWGIPYSDYCETNNLAMTGHYWEHGWPGMGHNSSNMAMYQWQQVPGIDCLFNQYNEGVNGQFGNIRIVKEVASVANQLGRHRRLCEIYGGGGWDIRLEDLKRIADWNGVFGINLFNQHLTHTTLRGARKHDYPQSFSYHAPWWDAYRDQGDYLARLSLAMTAGEEINKILVIEPTSTAWMYYSPSGSHARLREVGNSFQSLVVELAKNQVEFDLGCEDIIARHGKVTEAGLQVGQRTYSCIVVPDGTGAFLSGAWALLKQCEDNVLFIQNDSNPTGEVYVDGRPVTYKKSNTVSSQNVVSTLQGWIADDPVFTPASEAQGLLFHQRRTLDDGELLFLINTSVETACTGRVTCTGKSIQRWDLEKGTIDAYHAEQSGPSCTAAYTIPPAGSLLLFFSNQDRQEAVAVAKKTERVLVPAGSMTIQRNAPNVLTLDYCDVTVADETKKNALFYNAAKFVWQKHGLNENPWDHSVQFKDELISKTFPDNSGFTASFAFTIHGSVPSSIKAVVERPDLYTITCNGKSVTPLSDSWYLDRSFGVMDVKSAVQVGENIITLQASPMTMEHELERVFIIGDFCVTPTDSGFRIEPDASLQLGAWKEQGHPFYWDSVQYSQNFSVDKKDADYVVQLQGWRGSVAQVFVNGKNAGSISHAPWTCDISQHIQDGNNQIAVSVIGTPKNLLGPHHNNPPLGIASPWSFRSGPESGPPAGANYHQLQYGLFEPYLLKELN
jgi:hypothetical protein